MALSMAEDWRRRIRIALTVATTYALLIGGAQAHHACQRPCLANGASMTCEYHLEVEKHLVRSKACRDCPFALDDCFRADCIAADGVRRLVTVVNRQLPAPAIQICDGDKVVIVVRNSMAEESVSVHWHGVNQHGSPYMDGVPFVTQCPILPKTSFTYRFEPDPPGSHLYHAHLGTQRGDGLFGSFIVRKPTQYEHHRHLYDYDLPEHVLTVVDWLHEPIATRYVSHHHSLGVNGADSILVNGRGRHKPFENENGEQFYTPVAKFTVTQGYRYRFRVINAGALYCPIEIIIDDHKMKIIATDGFDIELVEADSLVTFAGERWDFVLDADREVGNYWMKFKGLQNCGDEFYGAFNVAILHYEGADDTPPEADVTYESIVSKGVQANPVNVPSADRSTLTISELKSVSKERDPALGDDPIRLIFYFDFYAIDNPIYHKANLYGYFDVPVEYRVRTQQINRISMKMPSFALLSQGENVKPDTFCNARRLDDCENEFCWCTHVEMLPLFRVVEIVLVDEGMPYTSNHPFHLHGYSFRVIATEKIGENTSAETVMRKLAANEIAINLRDPVFKDTVTVPRGGFTMVRIYLDNPGYWLLHCHLEFHSENGMAVVLKVGDYPDFPPVPENFPQCGDYWG